LELLAPTIGIEFGVFVSNARQILNSKSICIHSIKGLSYYTALSKIKVAFIFTYVILKILGILLRGYIAQIEASIWRDGMNHLTEILKVLDSMYLIFVTCCKGFRWIIYVSIRQYVIIAIDLYWRRSLHYLDVVFKRSLNWVYSPIYCLYV